ncbi:threonine--tRNA ligase [Hippea maritima]|uniref:Threonine--tRNA ligase n=1 Tax=Hippea maritima (strain ATCC 700847 / DSM 10411 / MH2) TaxID=760142 RepID=F2LY07_HIPMA|nr:threonine--tRNA ligase [Hippea maritima]AEA33272.1 threonyl-tRNA synthetase [Hippea maritima DSM 10411]
MELKKGTNLLEYVKKNKLKDIIAAKIEGKVVDLDTTLDSDKNIEFITINSKEGLEILRHSAAHIMAQAVQHVFGEAKFAIGPAIENGFYYDMDVGRTITDDDLKKIEKEMKKIVGANYKFSRKELPKEEAVKIFQDKGDEYKVEILKDLDEDVVSLYTQGDFTDLCRGPHIPSTGYLKHFKLLNVAGAYFKGDEARPMLQRIYGAAFATKEELDRYLKFLEEVKKRDHRKLGKQLDLFSINDEVGPGLIIWHPKGAMLRYLIEEFERKEHLKRGYEFVKGPEILRTQLWKRSGHFDHYRENMYFTEIDDQSFGIKPMNCLGHIQVYKSKKRSYRELPKRYFELGVVHRHEKSGVLHGLLRVREFTQDDAHIFCRPDQLNDEIIGVLNFVQDVMDIFGFEYELEISTRPENSIGTDQQWELATNALINALKNTGREYDINEGDGAFYGPKIDVKLKDALGRKWQCATIQCDFTLPERFDLTYVDEDGKEKQPVMVHRVILGSIERFIAILIENYEGDFPVWIAPVQVRVLPVSEKHEAYAKDVYQTLKDRGIRVEIEERNETLGKKIRFAETDKVPYVVVVGDKEIEDKTISVRKRKEGDLGCMNIDGFIERLQKEIDSRR